MALVPPPDLAGISSPASRLLAINQEVQHIANKLALFEQQRPIMLANSQASNHDALFDPTQIGRIYLAAPNPTTRNELHTFTVAQCLLSANALGLPPLPPHTPVITHRRRIAAVIKISIEE